MGLPNRLRLKYRVEKALRPIEAGPVFLSLLPIKGGARFQLPLFPLLFFSFFPNKESFLLHQGMVIRNQELSISFSLFAPPFFLFRLFSIFLLLFFRPFLHAYYYSTVKVRP